MFFFFCYEFPIGVKLVYFKLEGGGQKRGLQKVAEIVRTTIFFEKSCWYARFWHEKMAVRTIWAREK